MASKELTPSLRDQKLLEAAANGWSGEEMEAAYGMNAASAIIRVREILRSRNVFTDIERKQLLLQSALRLKEKIEKGALDLYDPKSIDAYNKVLKTVNDMLDKQGRITDAEINAAAKAQAGLMIQLISKAYDRARDWLKEEYGAIVDVAELDERFQIALREAAAEDDLDD